MSDTNTQRIPATLDKYLNSEIDLVVYGKSALHLLFEGDHRIYCNEAVCRDQSAVSVAFENNKLWSREQGMI